MTPEQILLTILLGLSGWTLHSVVRLREQLAGLPCRKSLAYLALLALAALIPVRAVEVTLAWDTNTETYVRGYKIYSATNGTSFLKVAETTHPTNTVTLSNLVYGATYTFYATAWSYGTNSSILESDPSTSISYFVPIPTPPTIFGQPKSVNTRLGERVVFTVAVSGTSPISYQWYWNGVLIPDATSSSYVIASVKESDIGQYLVRAFNVAGAAVSQAVSLFVPPGQIKNFRSQ